jgi:putative glycosyltransferase (TIGR04372 family)
MRGVVPGKFAKALNLLIDLGYLILQFGEHPPSIEVANTDRLINISERNDWRQLQVNAMFHSEFLISTNSGPSVLGWAMGVPVLQTDTVALCRNILTASEGSVYLPKSFKKKGTHVPLSELVASGLGYAEYSKLELLKQNIELIDNTEMEIFNAVLEMLDFQNWSKKDYEFSKNQESLGVVGRGKISTDYLAKSDWLKL